jgi:hypothetical protein
MRRGSEEQDWIRLASPSEPAEPAEGGLRPSRFAIAVLPTAAALVVLRRRARRRAIQSAWRQRTHGEVSAENQRMVDAHESEDRDARTLRQHAESRADPFWHPGDAVP